MLPLLELLADGEEHTSSELVEALALRFGLTDDERNELLPSGKQERFLNRASWARSYLKRALLIENTGRGRVRIAPRGIEALQARPERVDIKYLKQFPEFASRQNNRQPEDAAVDDADEVVQTPEEMLEAGYQSLRRELARDLLQRVKSVSPRFFERLVVDLLVAMGYGGSRKDAGQAVGQSGDGGIDGIIKEDRLGLDVVYVQAKRWDGTVGRPVVQAFAGSLEGQRARKGVLITTSQFSQDARDYVSRIEKKIVLIDGEQLAQLMIDYGIGVAEVVSYTVKRIDADYFDQD
jgi:restriction system protein